MALSAKQNRERSPSVISIELGDKFYEEFQRQIEEAAKSLTPDQTLAILLLLLGLSLLSSQASAETEQDETSFAWSYLTELQKELPAGKALQDVLREANIQLVVNHKPVELPGLSNSSELDDPLESFKRGWDDVMNGRTMSYEEFERRMLSDAD